MTQLFSDRTTAEAAANKLKSFAQPLRLMILSCLIDGELNVGKIDDATGIGQPALSQQLAALREAKLVKFRREGTQKYYSITDENAELCIRCLNLMTSGDTELASAVHNASLGGSAKPAKPSGGLGVAGFATIIE